MLVDGEVTYVLEYSETDLLAKINGVLVKVEPDSLEVFLPHPGFYLTKDRANVIKVSKLSTKQWKKTFNYDLYTTSISILPEEIDWTYNKLLVFKTTVFYLGSKVGRLIGNNIKINNYTFYQEVLDECNRSGKWKIQN